MLRFIVRLSVFASFGLFIFNVGALMLGNTRSPAPGAVGFSTGCEGIPQPCWYGVIPGETPLEDIDALLTPYGYDVSLLQDRVMVFRADADDSLCWSSGFYVEERYLELALPNCDVRLGDLLGSLGAPLGMSADCTGVTLYFRLAEVLIAGIAFDVSITPYTPVTGIILWMNRDAPSIPDLRWHGYISFDQYYLLEPYKFFGCGMG